MNKAHRIKREIQKISTNPPHGISCNFEENSLNKLVASIAGIHGTPYEKGVFEVLISISEKYPFEPPQIKFTTPVYHPNIDSAGRICMDLLKMPPCGAWRPTVTIEGLLIAIRSLLENPNPDDPLVPDIAEEFQYNRNVFEMKAKQFTEKHASHNKFIAIEAAKMVTTTITSSNNENQDTLNAGNGTNSKRKTPATENEFEKEKHKKLNN